jgi:hypothetical protein
VVAIDDLGAGLRRSARALAVEDAYDVNRPEAQTLGMEQPLGKSMTTFGGSTRMAGRHHAFEAATPSRAQPAMRA